MIFLNLFNRLVKRKDVYFKYSTSEQFVGDYWIDGKKIYQKTVSFTVTNETKKSIAHNIANIDTIVDFDCICFNGTATYKMPIVYYSNGTAGTFYDSYIYLGKTTIMWVNNTDWSGYTFYATIRYTKTTG